MASVAVDDSWIGKEAHAELDALRTAKSGQLRRGLGSRVPGTFKTKPYALPVVTRSVIPPLPLVVTLAATV
ncbi:MAG TPA: hypothetical protein VEL28_16435 [Candidatus Binatia bacterium]|nr:hypothetical protein [Candidatus Binatia bacterium]